MKYIKGYVFSGSTHIRKPDIGMYFYIKNKYKLYKYKKIYYVDDKIKNLISGHLVGFEPIWIENKNHKEETLFRPIQIKNLKDLNEI